MAYTTDLVYAIYGKDKTAGKTLKGIGKESKTLGEQFKHMGKVAAASFATIGAAAGAFAVVAAKAAIEDEKSQKALANALKNTTHATDAQIASTEKFISKMQLTYGIADDKLRPAFATLSRATGDLGESQNLLQVAMDISAATGKDLGATSLALAKAHNGNIGALVRLGIPLDKSIVKSKDFNAALAVLTKTFEGSAKAGADTFAGRMAIVDQRIKEAKEQIGYALMPMLQTMAAYLTDTVVPNVQAFVDGLTGVKNSSGDAYDSIHALGEKTKGFFKFLNDNKETLAGIATIIASIFIGAKAYAAVTAMVAALGILQTAFGVTAGAAAVAAGAEAAATGGASLLVAAPAIAAIIAAFGTLAGVGALSNLLGGENKEPQIPKGVVANAVKQADVQRMTGVGAGAYGGISYGPAPKPLYSLPEGVDIYGGSYNDGRAVGGSVSRGSSYLVGEHGPELFTATAGGTITRTENLRGVGGMTVVVNVQGSVVQEKDLAVSVRDNIAQLMRRKGLNPAILGV